MNSLVQNDFQHYNCLTITESVKRGTEAMTTLHSTTQVVFSRGLEYLRCKWTVNNDKR